MYCVRITFLTPTCESPFTQPLHSLAVNKRLDEWVAEEYLDTRKVQFPRKDGTTTGQNTGVTTPKRNAIPMTPGGPPSRPVSPVAPSTSSELVNGNAVLAAALHKKMSRKRKVSDGCDGSRPLDHCD